jgi:hypothetical protein
MGTHFKKLPRRARLVIALFAGIGVLYGLHMLTLRWSAPELIEARARLRTLSSELRAMGIQLENARERQTLAEQESAVMRQANRLLREEESARQAELHRLQGELDFYRRLAGTSGIQTGLAVYHLELKPTASERVFRFVLTLTQNLRRSAITTGTVRLALEGTLENRPVTLPWSRITEDNPPQPSFRFKYFEQISGYLALPEGFSPTRVVVTLKAKGQNKPVSRGFDWAQLTGFEGGLAPGSPAAETAGTGPEGTGPETTDDALHR